MTWMPAGPPGRPAGESAPACGAARADAPALAHAREASAACAPHDARVPMLVAAGVVTYAAAAWWSSRHLPWLALALAVAPFVWLAAAFALARPAAGGAWRRAGRWLPLLALCAALAAGWEPLLANVLLVYLAQHVGAHAALGWMFGASLRPGRTPLCTEFASWGHWRMTPQLVWYTRQVTRVWVAFFAGVAAVSLALFAAASPAAWMLFSSVLGPLLTAALFVVENLARRRYLPPDNRMGLMATWRAIQARARSQGKPAPQACPPSSPPFPSTPFPPRNPAEPDEPTRPLAERPRS